MNNKCQRAGKMDNDWVDRGAVMQLNWPRGRLSHSGVRAWRASGEAAVLSSKLRRVSNIEKRSKMIEKRSKCERKSIISSPNLRFTLL